MKQSTERCLKCLTAIYEDTASGKSITSISKEYARTYGTNPSIGTILQILGYITKSGAKYTRNTSMRKPDETMALEVMDELVKYSTKYRKQTPAEPNIPEIADNLVPVTTYKERVIAEVAPEIKSQALVDFQQIGTALKVVGVDILKVPAEKILEFSKILNI